MRSYFIFESDKHRSIMFLLELRTLISFSKVWAHSTWCTPTWILLSSSARSSFWIYFWCSLAFWILVCSSLICYSQAVILLAKVSNSSFFCSRLCSNFATLLLDNLTASHSTDWVSILFWILFRDSLRWLKFVVIWSISSPSSKMTSTISGGVV